MCMKVTGKGIAPRYHVTADNIKDDILLITLAKRYLNVEISQPCYVCHRCMETMAALAEAEVTYVQLS